MVSQQTISKTERLTIAELLRDVHAGKIRIPQFQRSFRWAATDVLALFDSIIRGYPFGNILLWRNSAPSGSLHIGAIQVNAPDTAQALWVVDGQQRITSIVNVVDPEAAASDSRFRLYYSLPEGKVVSEHEARGDVAIPLPDAFDFGRALAWLQNNPAAAQYTSDVQALSAALNQVVIPATVVEQAEEEVLREIFDRINSRGRRLNSAEIFNSIKMAISHDGATVVDLTTVADNVEAARDFGRLDEQAIIQALLVRRHPDITRDVHAEFGDSRSKGQDYPQEERLEAYQKTEEALVRAINFLQEDVGVPHISFLPFRYQLLVLTRFFSFYSTPHPRNRELLARWVWRTSTSSAEIGLTGSTTDVRKLAAAINSQDEHKSVQNLLSFTDSITDPTIPDTQNFRTNTANGKVILSAMWSLRPINPETSEPLTRQDLVAIIGEDSTPASVSLQFINGHTSLAANRCIATIPPIDFRTSIAALDAAPTLLLSKTCLKLLEAGEYEDFLNTRDTDLKEFLDGFIRRKTAWRLPSSPPISSLIEDDDDD